MRLGESSSSLTWQTCHALAWQTFNPLDADGDADYQALMFFPDKCCYVQFHWLSLLWDLGSDIWVCDHATKPGL